MVCATTGIMRRLDERELEGVLSHELSHVAHRDVTVMTIASFVGVLAGFLTRMALYSGMFGGSRRNNDNSGAPVVPDHHAGQRRRLRAVSFLLTRTLSRYRELAADRAGAFLTGQPSALASALTKISGEMGRIPTQDLRQAEPFNAFFFTPAMAPGLQHLLAVLHPPAAGEAARPARPHLRRARPPACRTRVKCLLDAVLGRSAAGPRPTWTSLFALPDAALTLRGGAGAAPDRAGLGLLPRRRGRRLRAMQGDVQQLLDADGGPTVERSVDAFGFTWLLVPARRRATCPGWSPTCTRSTPRCRTPASARRCCARWSASGDATGRRLGLVYLYKRGHVLPVRAADGPAARQRARAAGARRCSAPTCRSSGPGALVPRLGRARAVAAAGLESAQRVGSPGRRLDRRVVVNRGVVASVEHQLITAP